MQICNFQSSAAPHSFVLTSKLHSVTLFAMFLSPSPLTLCPGQTKLIVFSKTSQTLLYLAFAYINFSICLCCLFRECLLIFQISAQVYKLFSIFCFFPFPVGKGPYKMGCLSACFPLPESVFLTFEFLKLFCTLWNLRDSLNIF